MSDIPIPPAVKLDAAGIKRVKEAAASLEALERQAASLEKLGIIMPAIREQIEWARKAQETLLKDFT